MFEKNVSTIKDSLINENEQNEIVLFKAPTGSGKTNEIQNILIDALEKNSNKIFVVLFLTLHELDNFYVNLRRKYDDVNPPIEQSFNCVVKRSSLNKAYPPASLTDLEKSTLSYYKIAGISQWMKSRLLNSSRSNTDVFLLSAVYTHPVDYSFQTSAVWTEILLFIECRKYISTMTEEQIKIKTKSDEIEILNSDVLKIRKDEINTYLFIDEVDRYIRSSIFETLKIDRLSFQNGGVSFKERLAYTGLVSTLTHNTFSTFQEKYAEIHLSLKAFPSTDEKSLNKYVLKNGDDIKIILVCGYAPTRSTTDIGKDIQSRSVKDVYFVGETNSRYHVLENIDGNNSQFNVEQLNSYLVDGLQTIDEFSFKGKLTSTRVLINLFLSSHNSSIYRVVALDAHQNPINSYHEAQELHNDYLAEYVRCKEEKSTLPELRNYLSCNFGYQPYTFSLQTVNGASFARFKESFNHISCVSATWNENPTEIFFNSTPLQQRINFSCSAEEKYNVMLFLNSSGFIEGICFILGSPTNLNYLITRKLRENKGSKKLTNDLLNEIPQGVFSNGTEFYDVKSYLVSKQGSLNFINLFVHFLNVTFNGNMEAYSLKKFFKKGVINFAKKQLFMQEFKQHPVYSVSLAATGSHVKIKPIIFTCSYTSDEPIPTRENLSDLDCIILAFLNIMFNLNLAGGKDFININILNLFSCYDSSESHSRKIGDNYHVVRELGKVSPNISYLGANFNNDDLGFLDFEDLMPGRRGKILAQNKVTFLQKRKILNKEFENTTVFSEISKDPAAAVWENHFDSAALSSKHGVFRAALNLPDYNFICCNHTRQPSRVEFVHDCSQNILIFQSRRETFYNDHIQVLGRNQRVTPKEQTLYDGGKGKLPVRLYFLGNFFTKKFVDKAKDKVDSEVSFLLQELTKNSIFDKDSIEIYPYDYSANFLADLEHIYKRISNSFLEGSDVGQEITINEELNLNEKSRDRVINDKDVVKKNVDEQLKQIVIDELLKYLKEYPYLSEYLHKSSIKIIITTGGTITEVISRSIAKYVSKPNAATQSAVLSNIKNSPVTKDIFLGGGKKSMSSIFYTVESYFNIFFPDTKRMPTVVLSINNLLGLNKDVTEKGKSFLTLTGLGVPRYKIGPEYENEMVLIKDEFEGLSSEWVKQESTLQYLKEKLSSFQTIDQEEVCGDQFKFHKRRGRDTISFELSIKKTLFNLKKMEDLEYDVDYDLINEIFSRI